MNTNTAQESFTNWFDNHNSTTHRTTMYTPHPTRRQNPPNGTLHPNSTGMREVAYV